MEIKSLTTDQIALLKKPLPKEAVSPHPTKTYLSSIKAIYVIERLNDAFGIGSYQFTNREITKEGKMVVVESILTIPEYGIKIPSYGGNDNTDLGDAYKGAATDALTKICSYLGIGMDVFKGLKDVPKAENKIPENKGEAKKQLTNPQAITLLKGAKTLEVLKQTFLSFTPAMQIEMETFKNELKVKLSTDKPYLNENSADFTKMKAHIHSGGTMDEVESGFQVSDTVRELLLNP